jgi:hypothetical protein
MKRIEPKEGTKCQGALGNGCVFNAPAAHSFVTITDFDVVTEDLCSECYECQHTDRE